MGRQGGGSLRSKIGKSHILASRQGTHVLAGATPFRDSSAAAPVEELSRYLTVDEEIAQATRERAAEGVREWSVQFLNELAAIGLSVRWHIILTIKDRPGFDAELMTAEDLHAQGMTWLHRVNAGVSPARGHYRRRYGHSFFGYSGGPDWGWRRGRGHYHFATTDLPIFIAKRCWSREYRGGFWYREIHPGEELEVVEYVVKETCKRGSPVKWIPRKVFDWRAELALTGRRAPMPVCLPGRVADVAGTGESAPAWWADL